MSLTKDFMEAVEEGKVLRVRIMLKDSLLLDPTGRDFTEMLAYARARLPELLTPHDGEVFRPAEEWSEDYLNDEMVKVLDNFSLERLEHLQQLVKKLYASQKEEQTGDTAADPQETARPYSEPGKAGRGKLVIACAAALGIAVAAYLLWGKN